MGIVLDKKPGIDMDGKLMQFIMNATPHKLVGFIDGLEQQTKYDLSEIASAAKVLAFDEMLRAMKARTYRCNNSKRCRTELCIEQTHVLLVIGKKDDQDEHSMYVRLYDQHKDELLRLIDAQTVKEVVMA